MCSVGVFRPISLDLIFTYGDDAKLHGITEDGVRMGEITGESYVLGRRVIEIL